MVGYRLVTLVWITHVGWSEVMRVGVDGGIVSCDPDRVATVADHLSFHRVNNTILHMLHILYMYHSEGVIDSLTYLTG